MIKDPIKSLMAELGAHLSQREHHDVVLNNGKGECFLIEPSKFVEIKSVDNPRKIAFVDGGNGPLEESPNFTITVNRVCFSLFQGKNRVKPRANPRVQFFSIIMLNIKTIDGKKTVSYDTRLFSHRKEDEKYFPDESDLTSGVENTTVLYGAELNSLGRRFAEWQLAIHVVDTELERGDIIVMDGTLQTGFKNEIKYATKLYSLAMQKGVVVCGLSKTSSLITESGEPLLARIAEIAENVPYERWYVRVAKGLSTENKGFTLAVKLHAKSQFVFRFEILQAQFDEMTHKEIDTVLASLVANAQDIAMLGYPYGAIDADRFAQVRRNELNMYKGRVVSEMMHHPIWKRLQKYSASLGAHDILNKVSS